ncbi:MAG: hypothetical protein ACREJC_17720 [Tepidisphaeraceae bacterium]
MTEDRRYEGFSLLAGFVIGSLTIGLIAYLIAKTFAVLRDGGQRQLTGGSPINIYSVSGGQLSPQMLATDPLGTRDLTNAMALSDGVSLGSKMETYTLSPTRSVRVFSAPRKGPMWKVHIRVIGPAGGYGLFAVDNHVPDGPNTNLTIGSPQGIVVPANGWAEVRLGPRQILYGRAAGTEEDVQVSITASAEIV